MVGQRRNLVGHLFLSRIFPVGKNVRCNFRMVGQFMILVGHCPMCATVIVRPGFDKIQTIFTY